MTLRSLILGLVGSLITPERSMFVHPSFKCSEAKFSQFKLKSHNTINCEFMYGANRSNKLSIAEMGADGGLYMPTTVIRCFLQVFFGSTHGQS